LWVYDLRTNMQFTLKTNLLNLEAAGLGESELWQQQRPAYPIVDGCNGL
jgi:hypothetical protein